MIFYLGNAVYDYGDKCYKLCMPDRKAEANNETCTNKKGNTSFILTVELLKGR